MFDNDTSALDRTLGNDGIGLLAETVVYHRQRADELRAWSGRLNGVAPDAGQSQAEQLDADADKLDEISADSPVADGAGGEVLPDASGPRSFVQTLGNHPTAVAVDASRHRLSLAKMAGVAAMALDAAETVQAENSLEKMLAHQCAAAHAMAMELQAEARALLTDFHKTGRKQAILLAEAARLLNVSSRMMETTQRGTMTLHRLHHSGQQTLVVQHVQVNDGGRAVVAGQVKGGGCGKRVGQRG